MATLSQLEYLDHLDVAAHILGILDEANGWDEETLADHLYDKWGITPDTFADISSSLLRLTIPQASILTNTARHVFARRVGTHNGREQYSALVQADADKS